MSSTNNTTSSSTTPPSTTGTAKSPNAVEARILLDNIHVGGIIGKSGSNIKRVRDDSGAAVSILKSDSTSRSIEHRVMTIKGLHQQVCRAISDVAVLIYDSIQRTKDDTLVDTDTINTTSLDDPDIITSIKLLVHKSSIGAIIGKSGQTIKDTQESTQCRIKISNDVLPGSTEKSITLSGKLQSIYSAADIILQQLKSSPLKSGTKSLPYQPHHIVSYQQLQHQTPIPVFPTGIYNKHDDTAPLSTQKIAIPSSCVGIVIGKSGNTIRDLRIQSGTQISIADPEPADSTERVVTLTGTPTGIQTAVYLVRQLVEQSAQ